MDPAWIGTMRSFVKTSNSNAVKAGRSRTRPPRADVDTESTAEVEEKTSVSVGVTSEAMVVDVASNANAKYIDFMIHP